MCICMSSDGFLVTCWILLSNPLDYFNVVGCSAYATQRSRQHKLQASRRNFAMRVLSQVDVEKKKPLRNPEGPTWKAKMMQS